MPQGDLHGYYPLYNLEAEQHRANGDPYRHPTRALAVRILWPRARRGDSRVIYARQMQRSFDRDNVHFTINIFLKMRYYIHICNECDFFQGPCRTAEVIPYRTSNVQ